MSLLDQTLTAGSFITEMKRASRHNYKWTFFDQQRREYAWREDDRDRLLIYPSKDIVAEGNVTSSTGSGRLKIIDTKIAPEIPMLIAFYASVLQAQRTALALGFAGITDPGTRMRRASSRA